MAHLKGYVGPTPKCNDRRRHLADTQKGRWLEFSFPHLFIGKRYRFRFLDTSDPEASHYGIDELWLQPEHPFEEGKISEMRGQFGLNLIVGASKRCLMYRGNFHLKT